MATRVEVFKHIQRTFPLDELGSLGVGLAMREWDRDREFYELGVVVAALNPDPDLVSDDFAMLEETEGKLSSPANMPHLINVTRRAILYRSLPEDVAIDPGIQDELGRDYGRGIWGDSGKIGALGSGFLLTSFIEGLDEGGFPKQQSKAILREQIEHVIKTECAGKSSYTAVGALRYLYRVMKYAELHNPESRVLQIRRGAYLLKSFGLELADF